MRKFFKREVVPLLLIVVMAILGVGCGQNPRVEWRYAHKWKPPEVASKYTLGDLGLDPLSDDVLTAIDKTLGKGISNTLTLALITIALKSQDLEPTVLWADKQAAIRVELEILGMLAGRDVALISVSNLRSEDSDEESPVALVDAAELDQIITGYVLVHAITEIEASYFASLYDSNYFSPNRNPWVITQGFSLFCWRLSDLHA